MWSVAAASQGKNRTLGVTYPAWTESAIHVNSGAETVLSSSTQLTNVSNSTKGTVSFWMKRTATASGYQIPIRLDSTIGGLHRCILVQSFSNGSSMSLYVRKADNTDYSVARYVTYNTTDLNWKHFMWSWDVTSSPVVHSYVDGTSTGTTQTLGTDSGAEWSEINDSRINVNGSGWDIMDVYVTNEYIDLSQSANRAKFITGVNGCPVNLGDDGSLPTGNVPVVYFSGTADVWNSGLNRGTAPGFSITGPGYTNTSNKCG